MPTTIYDSSLITQRRRDKTISDSFINRIQNPINPNTGSAPLLGISQQSIINTVQNGQMTDYRKNDGGCTTVSPGCPCNIAAITEQVALLPPGVVTNVQFSYGSIIATYDEPSLISGGAATSYNVNLLPARGLSFGIYQNYFADNVNFFASANLKAVPNSGNSNNFSNLATSTANVALPAPADFFSVEWNGYFYATESGSYKFRTTSDDASYVWVGSNATSGFTTSNAVVKNGGLHGNITKEGTINLIAGTFYPIRVQYGEATGGQAFKLDFSLPSAPSSFITSGAYYFQGLPLTNTTITTTSTFPNNILVPTAQYYLSVNALNSAGSGPVGFYLSGGNPGLITGLYNQPTMTVTSTTVNTCTIGYSFSTAPGVGFTVTDATASPVLPAGWSLTATNSQIVLTKTAPNPASLPNTQKFQLTGASGAITYPSNAISGITTLGVVPSITQTGGSATTAILTVAAPYTGFTITGVSVDLTTPLPANWLIQPYIGGNIITLTWSGTGTSLISSGIKFILTDGTTNSPSSNAVLGIDIQPVPIPSSLTPTSFFPGTAGITAKQAFSFTTPNVPSDIYLYGKGFNNADEIFGIYTSLSLPTSISNNISNIGSPITVTVNGTNVQTYPFGSSPTFGMTGDVYNFIPTVSPFYTNPVLVNTSPSTTNYNIKISGLMPNTQYNIIGNTTGSNIGADLSMALASFNSNSATYTGQLALVQSIVTLTGFNLGGGVCTDGEIVGLSNISYPITLTQGVAFSYSVYSLRLEANGTISVIDGFPSVIFTYQSSTGEYLCTFDNYNNNPPGRDIVNKAYFTIV